MSNGVPDTNVAKLQSELDTLRRRQYTASGAQAEAIRKRITYLEGKIQSITTFADTFNMGFTDRVKQIFGMNDKP